MTRPSGPIRPSHPTARGRDGVQLLAAAAAERDAPRCGVCDQLSAEPLCRKCRALVNARPRDTAGRFHRPELPPPLPCPSCPGRLAHHPGACR